jgi:5-methylcytosine-specific restriction endonuclease McrA
MTTNISNLSRQELLETTAKLVAEERRVTAELITFLQEIERRKLHLELGYSSMYDFLTKGHGFSESAAARRLLTLRLTNDVPHVVQAIETGKLTLSTASQLGHFLKNEKKAGKVYTPAQKTELALKLQGMSSRDCERELFKISPVSVIQKESTRAVSATDTEIKFIVGAEFMAKFEKLKALLAHKSSRLGGLSYAQVFDHLMDRELKRVDPLASGRVQKNKPEQSAETVKAETVKAETVKAETEQKPTASAGQNNIIKDDALIRSAPNVLNNESRANSLESSSSQVNSDNPKRTYRPHIPLADRREIWKRAGGKCEYCDPKTGRRCNSDWALQIDHAKPLGQGGAHGLANFRLTCCKHNKFLAEKAYGPKFMSRYLKPNV